ncbi:LCP family glycopolymer transferase [Dubosiella newyorkensis]|uniref:Cell envelope-related transcriptional attenuator domain-containing protein n=2 Tax=Dubosiella newyorkensis TaxID=1862672 RepID=A0A1U7NKD5_9FIRM|nr:LCP family protein [Dubosiella newyorkensis]OLU44617.1 hypothetical protein BO225_10255 [Dubosiella newyorkensis]
MKKVDLKKKKKITLQEDKNKQKAPKKQASNSKLFDWILWSCVFALSIGLIFLIYQLHMLDIRFMLAAGTILLLLDVLFFVLLKKRKKKSWRSTLYKVVMVVLVALYGFGDYTLINTYRAFNDITRGTQSTIHVSLLVKTDSPIHSIEELANKKIGYSNNMDSRSSSVAMAQINTEVAPIEYVDLNDYQQLYDRLMNGEIDALIIPSNRIMMLKERYKSIQSDTRQLQEFSDTRKIDLSKVPEIDISKEPFVVYLSGIDEGEDPDLDARSDVNILVMVDPKNNQMTTVSIPRDSYMPNPAMANGSDKLTHLGNDGVLNSMEGIEEAFGIEIDYYAKMNFQSLIHIVDALGGVKVDVKIDFSEQDENRSFKKQDKIYLKKGVQTLNGKEALAYSRHRKTEGYGNTGRENAQQQIIHAIMDKLTSPEGIAHINGVMNVAAKYVSTNIPLSSLQAFISKQLSDIKPWSVDSLTLKGGVDATLTTVSMPSLPVSCYLLSNGDLSKVYNAYQRMFYTPNLKKFGFNLSKDPHSLIAYKDPQARSEYMITSEDAGRLDPYNVYYGIDRVDSSNASVSQNRAESEQIEVIAPSQVEQPVYTPSLPQEEESGNQEPSQGEDAPSQEETPGQPEPDTPQEPAPEVPEESVPEQTPTEQPTTPEQGEVQ